MRVAGEAGDKRRQWLGQRRDAFGDAHLRAAIAEKGALAVIPNNPSRQKVSDRRASLRDAIPICFSKLNQFRRVATRYEKTARNYLAVVMIAAIVLWIGVVAWKSLK